MANDKDIELSIRARDYSQKTFKEVITSVDELAKAQDAQRASAERGEASMKDLEASYKKLESAGQALLKLNSLVEVYKRQSAALEEQRIKLEATRQKQQDLNDEYGKAGPPTKKMEAALGRANKALEAQNKRFEDAQKRVSKTAGELQRYGVATDDLARTQSSIIAIVNRVNAVLAQQDKIISEAPAAAKRYADAKNAQAEADAKAANAAALAMGRIEEQAHAQNKIIDNLRRQAEQALATAAGYQTLARVVSTVNLSGAGNVGGQLQAIISPAAAARQTLDGLEKEVKTLGDSLDAVSDDSKKASRAMRDLQDAQKAAVAIARLIDQFRAQVTALKAAREEYRSARANVQALANQMRNATGDTQNLGLQMQAAQQRLNAAAGALRSTGAAARQTQAALRQAGVDTRNLSEAEARLIATTGRTVSSINALSEAMKDNADATKDGAKAFSFFEDEGRKTLSSIQRIRGELLSLITTYVGLQAGITLAADVITDYKMRQQSLVKIAQVVGNSQETLNAEWLYMTQLADKLGIKLSDLAAGYTSFAVAAKSMGLGLQETKFIFESVSKAGRVFHLSADDMQGVFRAMQQMLSKGQVYAEELTGQLGERLPGAVALFAKGMNMTTAELLKAMSNGEVSGDAVINFAREQAKAIDAQLATAEKGVDAMEARSANAMTAFRLALADSGFIDSYVALLQKVTDYLNSSDGREAAVKLGEAFSKLADVLIWCIDNVDLLVTALGVFAGMKAIGAVASLVKWFGKLGDIIKYVGKIGDGIISFIERMVAKMTAGTGVVRMLGQALGVLARAIPFVGWALLAYDIGSIFYEQSQTFAKAVDEVIRDFKNMGNQIVALVRTPVAALQDLVYGILRPITTMFSSALMSLARWIADVLKLIPGVGDELSAWALDVAENLTKENRDMFQNVGAIWDDVNKKWVDMNDQIVKKYDGTMNEVVKKTLEAKAKMLQADLAAAAGFSYTADPGSGITARDQEIKALTKQFDKLTDASKKAEMAGKKALQRKNLSGRLALVDEEYAPQMQRAKAVGGTEGDKLTKQLQSVIDARKRAETDEFNASQRSTKSATAGIDKRRAAVEALTQKYNELKASVEQKQTNQDPSATLQERTQAAVNKMQQEYNKLRAQAAKIGGEEGKQMTTQLNQLEQINTKYLNEKMQLEEVARLQDKVNSLLAIRKARIEELNSKREAGVISEDQQVAGVNQVNQQTQPGIDQAMGQLQAQGAASQSVMGPEAWAQLQANIAAAKASLTDLTGTFTKMDTTIVQGVIGGMNAGVSALVDNMAGVVAGTQSMGEAFQAAGVAVLQFFADFLKQIAMAILQQIVLNALAGMGGGIGGAATSAGGVAAKHNGGMVGSSTTGGMQQRGMNASWFNNAPRFHSGGLPGLKSDEVPAILQKGEQVLSKDDPNNIMNLQASQNRQNGSSPNLRFVFVDERSKVPEAMNSAEGEQTVLQILRRNAPSVRQIVKSSKNGRGG